MTTLTIAPTAAPSALEVLARGYLASCRARGLAPSTIKTAYTYTLVDVFLPWCAASDVTEPGQLTQRALDRFTAHLLDTPGKRGQPLSRHTVHPYVRVVRQLLAWCKTEGEAVTGARPQLPRLPRRVVDVLSREEIDRLEARRPERAGQADHPAARRHRPARWRTLQSPGERRRDRAGPSRLPESHGQRIERTAGAADASARPPPRPVPPGSARRHSQPAHLPGSPAQRSG